MKKVFVFALIFPQISSSFTVYATWRRRQAYIQFSLPLGNIPFPFAESSVVGSKLSLPAQPFLPRHESISVWIADAPTCGQVKEKLQVNLAVTNSSLSTVPFLAIDFDFSKERASHLCLPVGTFPLVSILFTLLTRFFTARGVVESK